MLVEFAIGSGDPNTAQVTVTATATKLAIDVPETRQGIKLGGELMAWGARFLDHDDFYVLKCTPTLSAGAVALIRELSAKLLGGRLILILDSGATLASLNRNQLRARMGL
jgi:hypothetical protein